MNRPNVLWLMSDQHNANCTGYAGNPNVRTPVLDRLAREGVEFTQAFCNNPICSPSRISFITGQTCNHHRMLGNRNNIAPDSNPDTLACLFRRYGYQTALVGKGHMVRRWDAEGFEFLAYTDLADADDNDPRTCHYFKYLVEQGLADQYEEGAPKPGQITLDGSHPASLPYEHSIERFTGEQSLRFLRERDPSRPFFLKMSFQRPHDPITPAPEDFGLVDPDGVVLPGNISDLFEHRFAGKPRFMQDYVAHPGDYPMARPDRSKLQRALASYYALIMKIDAEIGRVIDYLKERGLYDNTVVFYTSDHGDFAGEHGLFLKNLGIYESIHRIPFLLKWPGGPAGVRCPELVESVDWYATLCELCHVPLPSGRDGRSLVRTATGEEPGKSGVICEHHQAAAIRTAHHRLVYYRDHQTGELYDRRHDPGELVNLWDDPRYAEVRRSLMQQLLDYHMDYRRDTDQASDAEASAATRYCFSPLLHKHQRYYSDLLEAYTVPARWPRETG
jgi:arylsulfatase A-like enzyme